MEIQCKFEDFKFGHGETIYCCLVKECQIPENEELIFLGEHYGMKTNNDVEGVQFENCNITKVPVGLKKIFPNMISLAIQNSGLENICKDDLSEYKKLTKFICFNNKLEYLPGDLFQGFENLEWIEFWSNKLGLIDPNIFDELKNLKHVDIERNPNFSEWFSIFKHYKTKLSLEDVKNQINEKFFALNFNDLKDFLKKVKDPIETLKKFKEKSMSIECYKKIMEIAFDVIDSLQQEAKTGLITDLKNHIHDDNSKDFQIQIDDKEFKVHKFLLAARSQVLAETFKNNPEVENLNLVDISVEIFEQILNFVYTDQLPSDETNNLHLFAAAGRLQITNLKNYAALKLLGQINDENVYEIFKLSNKYNQEDLRQTAFDEIKEKYPKINFNVGLIAEPEKVSLIVEKFKKKEEAIKKLEDEFNNELISLTEN